MRTTMVLWILKISICFPIYETFDANEDIDYYHILSMRVCNGGDSCVVHPQEFWVACVCINKSLWR